MNEKTIKGLPGGLMLIVVIALFGYSIFGVISGAGTENGLVVFLHIFLLIATFFLMGGFIVVEPGGSRVITLFGKYKGTVKEAGFHFVNPFASKKPISLRVRTLNGEKLKVNDLSGNPIEIAAIVVWQVEDTYKSTFGVDQYEQYVALQSETALRHSSSIFPYDADDSVISLRRNTTEVSEHLQEELRLALGLAGVKVIDAKLSHLAYAPEIASAMLRRQQADAIIAARAKIVDGAVGMVEMALERMDREKVIQLDEERKAQMVSNLMVVLCSDHPATPIVNTGTLYGG